jgi:sulfofructosephosphate aldolase
MPAPNGSLREREVKGRPDDRALRRPSGAFAMLAIDQRESLRAMLAEKQAAPVTDGQIVDFKLAAIEVLSPLASAVLLDRDFALEPAVKRSVVAPSCGMIVAADRFTPAHGEIVGEVAIDEAVDPATMRQLGATALKLLVIWRPDEPPEPRVAMVDDFIARCRAAGLVSIIEPVSRKARDGRPTDLEAGIRAAAAELGRRGQDIYKAEIPLHGAGPEADVRRACGALSRLIDSPWVVLSSGVPQDQFPTAVRWACLEGASGFLAGRGVWRGTIGAPDLRQALRTDAADRLKRLCETVDEAMAR